MQDRDLDITKFSYNAYRKLKKMLGEFDAVVECNEIAIREFIEKAQSEDSRKYIQQLSSKHKVKVDEVDFIKFSSRIRHYYIASVFQQSEQFLKDFKEEWRRYFNDNEWLEPADGEPKLHNVLRNLSITIPSDLMDFYEYYRIVRNYMAHTDRDIEKLKARYKKIQKNKNDFLNDLNLFESPNSLDHINFDDFLILTNIVKHVAFIISNNSKPSNKRIAEILFELSKGNEKRAYKGLKKLKNDNNRYEKAIQNFAITSFGRFSTTDIEEVTKEIKCLLA
jgi:hypothetical protein